LNTINCAIALAHVCDYQQNL